MVGQRVLYLGDRDWQGHQIEDNTRKVVEELIGGRPFVVDSYPLGSRFPAA
ncbi:MAG: hypothetical protein WAV78_21700 [Xanthobacteraceae bacterium]